VDVRDTSLDLAKRLGAEKTINTSRPISLDEVTNLTTGGAHASLVLADSQDALDIAANITRKHGSICLVAAVS
jgi:D-arabinose 1-dehydrogenase-like Zn-dependent alcohol dehydrogenase